MGQRPVGVADHKWPRGDQRRKNISHKTLTEEEKVRRRIDINNDSSKRYRHRKAQTLKEIQEEELTLLSKNEDLMSQKEVLERETQLMQMLVNNVMRNK